MLAKSKRLFSPAASEKDTSIKIQNNIQRDEKRKQKNQETMF